MKKKLIVTVLLIISVAALALSAVFMLACGQKKDDYNWSLQNGLTAKFTDNGKYGFILTVEGSGAMTDYSSEKDAPWYGKSGRVTDIVISEGVTAIGAKAFKDIKAKSVILPESVKTVGASAFNDQTNIFARAQVTVADGRTVYIYSETEPSTSGNYWHFVGESAVIWETTVTKVLFIGNSFTFYSDIPALFGKIATGAGRKVEVESVTQGSHTLEKFADATDEFGSRVDAKLKASNDYDAVVLQEHSTRPLTDYAKFLAGAQALQTKINATQQDCKIYLYATWGYKDGADSRNITIPEMEAQLRTAYENAAKAIGAEVSYVGAAFTKAFNEHPELNLYFAADNKHPSYTGAYLSACVHVATILGCDPRISTYNGTPADDTDGVYSADMAQILKEIAYSTVFDR